MFSRHVELVKMDVAETSLLSLQAHLLIFPYARLQSIYNNNYTKNKVLIGQREKP